MFTRFVGVSRVARAYSSVQKNESALFLSDLMKRIDSINTRTKRISESQAATKSDLSKQKKAGSQRQNNNKKQDASKKQDATKKQAGQSKSSGLAQQPASASRTGPAFRTQQAKIAIKDHPLSRNTFKLIDESNFKKSDRGPSRRANPASRNAEGRTNNRPNARARPQRSLRSTPSRNTNTPTERVVQRELVVAEYKPLVSGDDFFHGKPASLAISTASRVGAVAKETLLESKYPYKLPKSIIDKLDSSFTGNKFILQNDFNLDVDVAQFGDKVNKVVKGKVDTIDLGKKPVATSIFTATQLARNGDLTKAQQQTIYDVASGLKSAKLLVEGAVWNK